MHQRTHKSNSSNPSRQEKSSPFFRHTAIVQAKQNSSTPPTQEDTENDAFAQNKFEAVSLQIKQTKGTITPIEQERLGVLQAKMDDLLIQRQERASRFGHRLANISLHSPDRPVSAPVQPNLPFGLSRISDTQQSVQKSSNIPLNRGMNLIQRVPTAQKHFGSPIQAKLTIGQPGDKYEQEADRVAQQVVQQLNTPKVRSTQLETGVQRQSKPEEDELRMKPMAMRFHDGPIDASADLEEGISRARGSGQPLDAGLQQSMGQAFGADFSGVRIHANAQSDQLNRSIQARAFTTGQDIFFRRGAYQPRSRGGKELLAHELTHVVQQSGKPKVGEVPIVRQEEKSLLRAKREVSPEEWNAWKSKNMMSKVEALEGKKVSDVNLEEIKNVYEKYKNGAQNKFKFAEKKEVGQKEALNVNDNPSTGSPMAYHSFETHYNILAVLTDEDKFHQKTRTMEKNVAVVKVIATRNPAAKSWKAYKVKNAKAGGADTVQYTGRYYPAQGKYFADENFKDRDVNFWGDGVKTKGTETTTMGQYGAPKPNSDIIYAMYQLAKALAEREKTSVPVVKALQKIRRHNIINADTLITMMQCDAGKVSVEKKNSGELIGRGTPSPTNDDYWALLGTPNGQAGGFIALQHTKTEKEEKGVEKRIKHVKYKDSELSIPIEDIQ